MGLPNATHLATPMLPKNEETVSIPFHTMSFVHISFIPLTPATTNTNSTNHITTSNSEISPVAPQRVAKLHATFDLFDTHKWLHCRWWCPPGAKSCSSLWYSKHVGLCHVASCVVGRLWICLGKWFEHEVYDKLPVINLVDLKLSSHTYNL